MGKRLIVLFAGAVAVVLAVSGCGSSDDPSGASITKAQFVKKADASCKKGKEKIRADFAKYVKEREDKGQDLSNPTEDDFAEVVDVVLVPDVEEEVEEIRDLGAPSGDEDQVDAILEAREDGLEAAEAEPKAVVVSGKNVFAQATKLAKEYGLEVCGTG